LTANSALLQPTPNEVELLEKLSQRKFLYQYDRQSPKTVHCRENLWTSRVFTISRTSYFDEPTRKATSQFSRTTTTVILARITLRVQPSQYNCRLYNLQNQDTECNRTYYTSTDASKHTGPRSLHTTKINPNIRDLTKTSQNLSTVTMTRSSSQKWIPLETAPSYLDSMVHRKRSYDTSSLRYYKTNRISTRLTMSI